MNPGKILLSPDEADMRCEVEERLRIARGHAIEVVLQDVQTVPGGAEQLKTWIRIAKSAVERRPT